MADIRANKPVKHGFDHGKGGQDPTPGIGGYDLVQDEGVDLTVRDTLNFTGAGVTASDDGSVTVVDVPGPPLYQAFSPTLISSGTHPTMGASTLEARYAQIGKLVHYYGQGTFDGSTFDPGTGQWELDMPFAAFAGPPFGSVGAAKIGGGSTGNELTMQVLVDFGVSAGTMIFTFPDAWPVGLETRFGAGVGYTFASAGFSDVLLWSFVYESV